MDTVKALVTGGNGFIGSHLVKHLLEEGYEVYCLVRSTSNLSLIEHLPVTLLRGDCRDRESLYGAVRGKDYIFHLAGKIKAPDWETYYTSNVLGTRNLIGACARENPDIRRFVHISSISAAGPSKKGVLKREEEPCVPITDYGRSKLMGEVEVRKYEGQIPFVIIRPPNVLGPGSEELLSMMKILIKRIRPALGNGDRQTSICFVQDLVRAIVLAATSPEAVGKTYYITDGNTYSWRFIGDVLSEELGLHGFILPLPYPVVLLLSSIIGLLSSLMGKGTMISPERVRQMRETYWIYDGSKAERDLGFKPVMDIQTGIRDAVRWYRERGLL